MKKFWFLYLFIAVAHLSALPQTWSLLGSGTNEYIISICEYQNSLYVGGSFTEAGGQEALHIARWDGFNWYPVGLGVDGGSNTDVDAMIVFNGELYVAGRFSFADTIAVNNIAKWNGTEWSAVGGGLEGIRVYTLEEYNGELYAGGDFDSTEGNIAQNIAKWNGTNWTEIGNITFDHDDFPGDVSAMHVFNDELYVGGLFNFIDNLYVRNIAKWNGVSWSAVGNGFSSSVNDLVTFNNELYAAGNGLLIDSTQTTSNFVRWDGLNWLPSDTACPYDPVSIYSLCVYQNELYLGGNFSSNQFHERLYKYDGITWTVMNANMNDNVFAMTVWNDDLYIGGRFDAAIQQSVGHIIKWGSPASVEDGLSYSTTISIYPNPATTEITVSGYSPAYLKLCNAVGQTVAESKSNKLYVGNLSQGLYVLQLFDANGQQVKTEKVIVAK